MLGASAIMLLQWDGSYWELTNPAPVTPGRVILTQNQSFILADYGLTPAIPVTVTVIGGGQGGVDAMVAAAA